MNWDAVGAIAEVVGVIGIVVSIIYLGIQVRHSNVTAEDNAFKGTLALGFSSYFEMTQGDNADVIMKGLLHYDGLTGRKKLIFDNLMTTWFSTVEASIAARDREFLGDQTIKELGFMLRTRLFPYSGISSWWSESKDIFSQEIQDWFEREMSRTDMDADFYGIKEEN